MEGAVEQVMSFQLGQDMAVWSIVGLPGGGFATGHKGKAGVRVWRWDGELEATLDGHTMAVPALALGATPGTLVSGSYDNSVKVWSLATNACVLTCAGHASRVNAVAVSHVGGAIVSVGDDNVAKVWLASTGECMATLEGHTRPATAVCVLSDGDVATGSADKTVRVWQRDTWTCSAVLDQSNCVFALVSLPRNAFALSGGVVGRHGSGFVSGWRDGALQWTVNTLQWCYRLALLNDILVACTPTEAALIQGGQRLCAWPSTFPCPATLSGGRGQLAFATQSRCTVYNVIRPTRIAALHVMVTAWAAHGGVPAPLTDAEDKAAILARTLSLRRFCRPRGETEAERPMEVVEIFARGIVGFL